MGRKVMSRVAPYSQPTVIMKADGRSREAKRLRAITKALREHVGPNPTVAQDMLIATAALIWTRITLAAPELVGQGFSEHDDRQIIAWLNALTRTLVALGIGPKSDAPPDLRSYLDGRKVGL